MVLGCLDLLQAMRFKLAKSLDTHLVAYRSLLNDMNTLRLVSMCQLQTCIAPSNMSDGRQQ